jgi:peptidyl-prolyl cis-trans isomerase D
MFDLVQKYKKFIQLFLGLLAITFLTWGLESYTRMGERADTMATVNGLPISEREFQEAYRNQQEQVRRLFGGAVDPAMLDSPESRQALLDSIVSQRLVASEVGRAQLLMSREAVIDLITNAPEFQENGAFSTASYSAYLAQRNISDAQNVAELQSQLPMSRLVGSIAESAIVPRTVAERLAAIEGERREIAEFRILTQPFEARVQIDDAKLKAYYDANPADFRTPERVRAEYVVLSAENLGRGDPPAEAELRAAYEAAAARYRVEEQRRASHILLKDKAEAEKLLAELRKAPGQFAALAKKSSLDTGSAEQGGDLGMVSKDSLASAKLAAVVFGLKAGELAVAESEFGFHVVRVTAIQAGKARSFDEVRGELAAELGKQRGTRRFAEAAEAFTNMVYEQSDSLRPAAERFKLQVQATGWIGKSARQELGALDNPRLLSALFSSDALLKKRNTDAIEVAPSTLVAARVLEHQPAAQRKFDEVKGEIAQLLRNREASEMAYKDGVAKLEALKKGEEAGVRWGAVRNVSRREAQGLPADVLRRVVAADASKLPAYVGIPIPDSGYLLVRISRVTPGVPASEQEKAQALSRALQTAGAAQFEAYVASLKARASVDVKPAKLEKK